MKLHRLINSGLLVAPVFFLLTFSSGVLAEQSEIDDAAPVSESATESAEPMGLDIVMDGSSLEAFEQSMEKVKETGGERDYMSLKDAFKYLLVFDIGARNDPEVLASRLNGLTGNEILTRVKYRRN